MIILGVHHGHDSCAALVVDGRIVADVAEERFTRIKHYSGLPYHAVRYCLEAGGIGMDKVDVIAIASGLQRPHLNLLFAFPPGREQKESLQRRAVGALRRARGYTMEGVPLYLERLTVHARTEIVQIEHHLAHAASAYLTSGTSERQLIATLDGTGDNSSTCLWIGERGRITPVEKFGMDASLGIFYSNVTEALGWWHGDGEGKTMGLAPYGDPEKAAGALKGFHPVFEAGRLTRGHSFGDATCWNEAAQMHHHFAEADVLSAVAAQVGRENLAAEAQRVLEEQACALILPVLDRHGLLNLSCAGGVFLNVKLNQVLREEVRRRSASAAFHVYPNAGDSGLACGAALAAHHIRFPDAVIGGIDHLYLGPEFSNAEIADALALRKLSFSRPDHLPECVAGMLAENRIVGWFQGRMESGPRSLGNRAILMSANRAENKDVINERVKFREGFRPFCPSLLAERAGEYLAGPEPPPGPRAPFMIEAYDCTGTKRTAVPAVVHVDGTLRPQTVERAVNPLYHSVLSAFEAATGEGLLLNTSLNVMGEPICRSPGDAVNCFYNSGMDALVIGDCLLRK